MKKWWSYALVMFGKHSPTLAESGAFWPHPAGVCRGWIAAGSLVVRCNSTASCWYQCCVPEIFSLVTPHVHQATHLSRLVKGKNTMHSYFFGPWKILKILGPGRNQTPDNPDTALGVCPWSFRGITQTMSCWIPPNLRFMVSRCIKARDGKNTKHS